MNKPTRDRHAIPDDDEKVLTIKTVALRSISLDDGNCELCVVVADTGACFTIRVSFEQLVYVGDKINRVVYSRFIGSKDAS